MRLMFVGAMASGLAFALSACSPAAEAPAPTPTPAAEPAPAAAAEPAPAVTTPETPAAEPAATPTTDEPTAMTAQTIALDIKDASGAAMSGDTARGQTVFKKCMQCHSAVEGKNGTGPSLYGIVGRISGSIPNFRYSEANRTSGITWTEQEMFVYLENPKKRIPKTIMAFVGLPKAQDRADVIAYLKVNAQK
ncbi:MAG: cytochrome c family protein [Hyphomonadaceae bacterium]|nr:cytochrome c family protein [Hyphomonadaceae bacterium]